MSKANYCDIRQKLLSANARLVSGQNLATSIDICNILVFNRLPITNEAGTHHPKNYTYDLMVRVLLKGDSARPLNTEQYDLMAHAVLSRSDVSYTINVVEYRLVPETICRNRSNS